MQCFRGGLHELYSRSAELPEIALLQRELLRRGAIEPDVVTEFVEDIKAISSAYLPPPLLSKALAPFWYKGADSVLLSAFTQFVEASYILGEVNECERYLREWKLAYENISEPGNATLPFESICVMLSKDERIQFADLFERVTGLDSAILRREDYEDAQLAAYMTRLKHCAPATQQAVEYLETQYETAANALFLPDALLALREGKEFLIAGSVEEARERLSGALTLLQRDLSFEVASLAWRGDIGHRFLSELRGIGLYLLASAQCTDSDFLEALFESGIAFISPGSRRMSRLCMTFDLSSSENVEQADAAGELPEFQ